MMTLRALFRWFTSTLAAWRRSFEFAAGGTIPAPRREDDTIPVILSPGGVQCDCGWSYVGDEPKRTEQWMRHARRCNSQSK